MIDPEYRLDKDKAMAGLRTLVGEYHRVIEQAEHLAARLRITHLKIGACLEAATGDPIAPAPAGDIELQVSVKHAGWRQFEQAISAIQARHNGITIDEACNDIFLVGILAVLAQRDPELVGILAVLAQRDPECRGA